MVRRRRLACAIGLLVLWATGFAEPAGAQTFWQESALVAAGFAHQRLWIVSDQGALSSIAEGETAWRVEPLQDAVTQLCVAGRHLTILVGGRRTDSTEWSLLQMTDSGWIAAGTIDRDNDFPVAMACDARHVALLTTRRLIDLAPGGEVSVALAGKIPPGVVTSSYDTPDALLIGIDAGEWGGGLHRIERTTGKVTVIELNATGKLCGGPLNSACDPVNGIAPAPWDTDCVVAAVGLTHLQQHGSIVEVCPTRIRRLYYAPLRSGVAQEPGEDSFASVAFFGLVSTGGALWASAEDGLYRIREGGATAIIPLPRFEKIGGVRVSFAVPDLILVEADANRRMTGTERVPLMVPR